MSDNTLFNIPLPPPLVRQDAVGGPAGFSRADAQYLADLQRIGLAYDAGQIGREGYKELAELARKRHSGSPHGFFGNPPSCRDEAYPLGSDFHKDDDDPGHGVGMLVSA